MKAGEGLDKSSPYRINQAPTKKPYDKIEPAFSWLRLPLRNWPA
jgi:hypothetical protein